MIVLIAIRLANRPAPPSSAQPHSNVATSDTGPKTLTMSHGILAVVLRARGMTLTTLFLNSRLVDRQQGKAPSPRA